MDRTGSVSGDLMFFSPAKKHICPAFHQSSWRFIFSSFTSYHSDTAFILIITYAYIVVYSSSASYWFVRLVGTSQITVFINVFCGWVEESCCFSDKEEEYDIIRWRLCVSFGFQNRYALFSGCVTHSPSVDIKVAFVHARCLSMPDVGPCQMFVYARCLSMPDVCPCQMLVHASCWSCFESEYIKLWIHIHVRSYRKSRMRSNRLRKKERKERKASSFDKTPVTSSHVMQKQLTIPETRRNRVRDRICLSSVPVSKR